MHEQDLEKKLSQLKNIRPSIKLVDKVISDYNQSIKGRISFNELISNQIYNPMAKWKIIVPLVVLVLVIVVLGATELNLFDNKNELGKAQDVSKEMLPIPEATGNIDDTIDAILTFSENEGILMGEEVTDANLLTADSQEIIDFGQSYNENEL
jgi:hypothetical protein